MLQALRLLKKLMLQVLKLYKIYEKLWLGIGYIVKKNNLKKQQQYNVDENQTKVALNHKCSTPLEKCTHKINNYTIW